MYEVRKEAEASMQPTLVMYDDDTTSVWTTGVEKKGVAEPIVDFCLGNIDQSGYSGERLASKHDQQSNGMMEGAARMWQEQLIITKHNVELLIWETQWFILVGEENSGWRCFILVVDTVLRRRHKQGQGRQWLSVLCSSSFRTSSR